MRDANHRLPFDGTPSSAVLLGIARGLEDLFPVGDELRGSHVADHPGARAESDSDEAEPGIHRAG